MRHHAELLKDIEEGRGNEFEKPSVYQDQDDNAKCYVRLRHLSKFYGPYRVALENINININHVRKSKELPIR